MPRVAEIIEFVKSERGRTGRFTGLVTGRYTIAGACEQVVLVADVFGGSVYRSNKAKGDPRQRFPGHSVAVVPVERGAGVVVDFTDTKRGPIIGGIADVSDQKLVLRRLKEISGETDWRRREVLE